jgi:hypothetical protein
LCQFFPCVCGCVFHVTFSYDNAYICHILSEPKPMCVPFHMCSSIFLWVFLYSFYPCPCLYGSIFQCVFVSTYFSSCLDVYEFCYLFLCILIQLYSFSLCFSLCMPFSVFYFSSPCVSSFCNGTIPYCFDVVSYLLIRIYSLLFYIYQSSIMCVYMS